MRLISLLTCLVLVFCFAAAAQDTPKADLFLGYSFLRANSARTIPAFTMNGGVGTLGLNINNHLGLEFEFGGHHNGNINNYQFDTTTMTYLFGPRFTIARSKRVHPYLHTLFGGMHLTTSILAPPVATPVSGEVPGSVRVGASQDAFAMAMGGGLDVRLGHHVTFRPIQLDWVMTRLEDFALTGQPSQNRNQHHLRYAAGFMFTFGGERPSPPPTPPARVTKQCAGGTTVGVEEECPKQNIGLGLNASSSDVCPGDVVKVTPAASLPDGAVAQWTVNGEQISEGPALEFGTSGREPGTYRIGLKVAAAGYNDASADTSITVRGYTPPVGNASASPAEIWLGEKATVTASFRPGQCGGTVGPVTFSVAEGSMSGNQYDSTGVQFAPPDSSEQRKTVTVVAKAADERGSGSVQTEVVVKQKGVVSAKRLPDVLFAKGSDRVNNCGKRVLLEQLRTLTDSDPTGKVVFVGHTAAGEPDDLDSRRALNAAAVISAGQGVCTAFPASQILLTGIGAADNGAPFQPNFCAGSTATPERAGQIIDESNETAKYRRVEVWFVPTGGTMPSSASGANNATTFNVSALGCPR